MRILGIDPGFAIVGFGVVEADRGKQRLIQCGAINTPAGVRLPARLLQISEDMRQVLSMFQPDAMAVEELFFTNNITTGISVAQARGVILTETERVWKSGQASNDGNDPPSAEPEGGYPA